MTTSVVGAAARAAELARATLLAWPKSGASYELARLIAEGYEKGESCDVAFSVSCPDASQASDAAASARVAGFTVDTSQVARGFVTVQTGLELRTFGLARTIARLERLMAPHEGYVAVIGPVQPPRRGARAPVETDGEDEMADNAGRAVA